MKNDINNKMRLLSGKSLPIKDDLRLYSVKLGEISDIGYDKYMEMVNILTFKIEDVKNNIEAEFKQFFDNLTLYDYIIQSCSQSDEFKNKYVTALSLFLNVEIEFDKFQNKLMTKKLFIEIDKNDLDLIREGIKLQNCITDETEKDTEEQYDIIDSEMARKFLARIQKEKKIVEDLKSKTDSTGNIDISDIISGISVATNGLNILSVWDLTIYQLYNQLNRNQLYEKYNSDLNSIFAGADPSKVKIEYYITHME